MAYYRRYRRSRRPIRRVSRFGRHTRRFARNLLAAYQQRDIGRFTIKVRKLFEVDLASGVRYGAEVLNIWSLLGENPQFAALKALFDQVKINGARVSATSTVQPSTTSAFLPTFVYAWDRNGVEALGTGEDIFAAAASYGSSRMQPITPGTHNSFTTSIVAQDIQERSIYISTSAMNQISDDSTTYNLYFKPNLIVAVNQPGTVQGTAFSYKWEMDVAIDVTFRGTRYSQ